MIGSRFVAGLRAQPAQWAALGLFVLLSTAFYLPYLSHLPEGLHAWAQADRLALALNFYDAGFDLWHPRTSTFLSIGGITGVEFPLPAYAAALGGLLFGRGAIGPLFRLLDVAVAVLGFWYLFRLVYERTGHFVAALVPGAFLLSSPTYAFYASTYLPDPVSLSLSFVAYYYWLRFFSSGGFRWLVVAIAILTVASLLKTTTALFMVAVVGITMLWASQQPSLLTARQRWQLLVVIAGAVGSLAVFILHNEHLNTTYASEQFLAEARPITTPEVGHRVWLNVYRDWLHEYATRLMYGMLAASVLLVLVRSRASFGRPYLPLTLLTLSAIGIGWAFAKLMGAQFDVHDYYVICSFIPPAVLVLVLALLHVGRAPGLLRHATTLGLGVLVLLLLGSGYKRVRQRYSDDYQPFSLYYTYPWMRGGAAQLQRLAVPATARVLVLDDPAPNLGLVYFDRRGLTWQPDLASLRSSSLLDKMAGDSLTYVIMSPAAYGRLASEHAALATDFTLLAKQPAVVLRRRNQAHPW